MLHQTSQTEYIDQHSKGLTIDHRFMTDHRSKRLLDLFEKKNPNNVIIAIKIGVINKKTHMANCRGEFYYNISFFFYEILSFLVCDCFCFLYKYFHLIF